MVTIVIDNYAHRVTNAKVLISAPLKRGHYNDTEFEQRSYEELGMTGYEIEVIRGALRNLNLQFPEGREPLPTTEETFVVPPSPMQPMAVA